MRRQLTVVWTRVPDIHDECLHVCFPAVCISALRRVCLGFLVCFLDIELHELFVYFGEYLFYHLKIFSPILFFFFFFTFQWKSNYSVISSCCTPVSISCKCTYIPPSWVSQETHRPTPLDLPGAPSWASWGAWQLPASCPFHTRSVQMSVPFCQLAHPLLPGACSHAHSLQLWLYFCPVDRFIYNTTSRVHIYVSSMILFSPLIYSLRMTALSLSTSLYMIQFPLFLWLNNIPSYMHTTFLKFILNWRIIACQCCVAFCCTSTRII